MQINYTREVVTKGQADIEIKGITLLSHDEAMRASNIADLTADEEWWLRSRGTRGDWAEIVYYNNCSNPCEGHVDSKLGVRPVLRLNPESSDLQIGDKIEVAGHVWTVIPGNIALCDDIVGESPFREDYEAEDANDYEASDVKKWLENWWSKVNTAV